MKQMYGVSLVERFWAKVDKSAGQGPNGECWEWIANRFKNGYGAISQQFNKKRRTLYAHRVSWELAYGQLPDKAVVLHKCDNPSCVNPAHLSIGSQAQNLQDMASKGRHRNQKDICKRGHLFTQENTRILSDGRRNCRLCANQLLKARRQKAQQLKARQNAAAGIPPTGSSEPPPPSGPDAPKQYAMP